MKRVLGFLIIGAAVLLVAGCKPICETDALVAPVLSSPSNWAVVPDLSPSLSWMYPDDTCTPEGYRIELSASPFGDELAGGTGSPATTWGPGAPLMPTTQYWWRVLPINGTTLGPASSWWRFFTGPACDPADPLGLPLMVYPPNGNEVTTPDVYLRIGFVDGCIPPGAYVDISKDPDFSDIEDPTHPSVIFDWPMSTAWIASDLEDCTMYYWRAIFGENATLHGPFAYAGFYTNFTGACPPAGTPGTISGTVWLDSCMLPGVGPFATPPDGCAEWGPGIYWGDAIRQPGEDGIADVAVALSPGPCPAGFGDSVLTDLDGNYEFTDVTPGDYCLAINAAAAESPLPMEGRWTIVPSGHEGWTYRIITLHTGETLTGQDFAWSLLRTPAFPTAVPLNSIELQLKPCSEMGEQECKLNINSERCQWLFHEYASNQGGYYYCTDK